MREYSKQLVEKATKILNESFIYDEISEGWIGVYDSFLPTNDKDLAIAIIAKHINRRGNKKLIRFKDWLYYNKLHIPMKGHVA